MTYVAQPDDGLRGRRRRWPTTPTGCRASSCATARRRPRRSGTIDVRSEGFGVGDPEPGATQTRRRHPDRRQPCVAAGRCFTSQQGRGARPRDRQARPPRDRRQERPQSVTIDPGAREGHLRRAARRDHGLAAEGHARAAASNGAPTLRRLRGLRREGPPRSSVSRGGLKASRTQGHRAPAAARSASVCATRQAQARHRRSGSRSPSPARRASRCQLPEARGQARQDARVHQPTGSRARLGPAEGQQGPVDVHATRRSCRAALMTCASVRSTARARSRSKPRKQAPQDDPHPLTRAPASLSAAMPSRRDQIRMTDDELRVFLAEQKIVSVATIGPNGRPHLVPLWYVADGDELRGWTFAKSQKAKNLERDPHATLQVEAGVEYQELRGVMFEVRRRGRARHREGRRLRHRHLRALRPRRRRRAAPTRCARWSSSRRRSGSACASRPPGPSPGTTESSGGTY